MPTAPAIWESNRPGGFLRAVWRDDVGQRVTWDTATRDRGEAMQRAVGEISRRRPAATEGAQQLPTAPAVPANGVPPPAPGQRPLAEAFTRALHIAGPAPSSPAPSSPGDPAAAAKSRRLYEVFGRALALVTEGTLKRCVRYAGREPADMDEDEVELIREGWEEKGQEWFGKVEVGPWGKIALGAVAAGAGMYMGGTPVKRLPPADQGGKRPQGDDG